MPDDNALDLEAALTKIQLDFFNSAALRTDTEFHGKEMLHGKGNFKQRKLSGRIQLFEALTKFVIDNELPIRLICIDVKAHRQKYNWPMPEYRLGLMLILERFCDYLEQKKDIGAVFGDYEKDEISRAILDFAEFKVKGKTLMYYGRPLDKLIDTVYFTHTTAGFYRWRMSLSIWPGAMKICRQDPENGMIGEFLLCGKKLRPTLTLACRVGLREFDTTGLK